MKYWSKKRKERGKKGRGLDFGQCLFHFFKICAMLAKVQKRTQPVHYT